MRKRLTKPANMVYMPVYSSTDEQTPKLEVTTVELPKRYSIVESPVPMSYLQIDIYRVDGVAYVTPMGTAMPNTSAGIDSTFESSDQGEEIFDGFTTNEILHLTIDPTPDANFTQYEKLIYGKLISRKNKRGTHLRSGELYERNLFAPDIKKLHNVLGVFHEDFQLSLDQIDRQEYIVTDAESIN